MPAEPNPIQAILAERGSVSFRDFMELALYHQDHGYYGAGRALLGRQGDYFTSVNVGAIFGQLLAWQFAEMWRVMSPIAGDFGAPSPSSTTFAPPDAKPQVAKWNLADAVSLKVIVEQGANDGAFAADVLAWIRDQHPQFYSSLHYRIIEPLPALRDRQRERLHDFAGKVTWYDSLEKLPRFGGVFFSNELVDAFPVHLVRYRGDQWRELWVTPDLEWEERPLPPELAFAVADMPQIDGYTTEINLEAAKWAAAVASKLIRGWILTIDYGYPRDLYYSPERHTGTLLCYSGHTRSVDPLENPGVWDITAHVDFTSLAMAFLGSEPSPLQLAGFTDQHHFLTGIAAKAIPEGTLDPKILRALKTLLHPEMLGRTFQILGISRDVPAIPLSGFLYARDGRKQLGLRDAR